MEYPAIKAMNWSSLKNMSISARYFKWRLTCPMPPTKSMILGSAVHCAILENDKFQDRYVVKPDDINLRTDDGKKWKKSLGKKVLLSRSEASIVANCATSVMENQRSRDMITSSRHEEVITWETAGVPCKARVDAINQSMVIDIKTTRNLFWFDRDINKYTYNGQLAWYLDGAIAASRVSENADAYIIAVETVEAYDTVIYRLSEETINKGRRIYEDLLGYWKQCSRADTWPGQQTEEVEI